MYTYTAVGEKNATLKCSNGEYKKTQLCVCVCVLLLFIRDKIIIIVYREIR